METLDIGRERLFHLGKLPALARQFVGEGERPALARAVGRQPALRIGETLAIALLLFRKPADSCSRRETAPSGVTVTGSSIS